MKKNVKTRLSIVIISFASMVLILANAPSLFAVGNGGTGGGMVISCAESTYLADTFNLMASLKSKGVQDIDAFLIQTAILQVIEKKMPEETYPDPDDSKQKVSLATMLEHVRKKLVYVKTNETLPLLGDDNIDESKLPVGCSKQQVAIQDIPKRTVLVNHQLQMSLTSLERGLLEFHETLIGLRNQPGVDTTPIREKIENLMKNELNSLVAIISGMNSDCHIRINRLELFHGCFNFYQPSQRGPGACEYWSSADLGPADVNGFIKTAPNHFAMENREKGLSAQIHFDGSSSATVSIQARGASQTIKVRTENKGQGRQEFRTKDLTFYPKNWEEQALSAVVSCDFGITESINNDKLEKQKKMDALGPAAEWSDPSAPSLSQLPMGTILEFNQDLEFSNQKNGPLKNYIVEQHPTNMSWKDFWEIPLGLRYAYLEFYTANNGYGPGLKKYPKGTKLVVTELKIQPMGSNNNRAGLHSNQYVLRLKAIHTDQDKNNEPIMRMEVYGRRGGRADIKIPQFIELAKPSFKVTLPPRTK